MYYNFKPNAEFAWFVFVAVVVTLMQVLADFDASEITDWSVWAVGVGSGLVRAVAGAVLAAIGSGSIDNE